MRMRGHNEQLVIGIDPGLAATGWGIITSGDNYFRHVAHGTIRTSAHCPVGERLSQIYHQMREVVQRYQPQRAGVESLYFARNVTSAIPVAQARGIILLLLNEHAVACAEYPPQIIKRMITDDGRASKSQVREMVGTMLEGTALPAMSAHAVDAIAAAICHCNSVPRFA